MARQLRLEHEAANCHVLDFIFHSLQRLSAFVVFSCASVVAGPPATDSSARVFDPGRAHTIQINLSGEGWDLLQPDAGARKAAGRTNREQAKIAGVRLRPGSTGYAYVLGEMEFDGRRIADVGLRFKGSSSYSVSSGTLRRPMKVDF